MRKLKRYKDGGPKVKQRRGVRKNYDNKTWTPSGLQFPTSVSSHLMRTEYIPERGWVAFPSLFQDSKPYADDQQNWVDMSEEEDWMKIYKEAERRGEVYDFGEDKEAALAFGEGSWKDQLPNEGVEVELTDEEVERYIAGGYVLEKLKDGGEDELITYKNNKSLVEGTANWNSISDVYISSASNYQIQSRLLTGKYGYNPKTGELVKLNKSQQTKVTDPYAIESRKDLEAMRDMTQDEVFDYQQYKRDNKEWELHKKYIEDKVPVLIDRADAWRPHFQLTDESGNTFDTYDRPGEEVLMTPAQKKSYLKAMVGKNAPIAQQQMNTLFSIPASFTPAGLGIMGVRGATNLALKSGPEFVENPSLSNAGYAGLDLLMASPIVIPAGISAARGANNLRNVKLPSPKMDLNKLGSYPISKEVLPTTVKGTKEYIKNFKPKQTLQLESSDMKFDRALAEINRKSIDNPVLTRVFSQAEFADDFSGLKVRNPKLSDGTNWGRRTKHFGTRGEGAAVQFGDSGYNTMYIGNLDDIKKASNAHLRLLNPGDTYFYSPDEIFTLSNEGVYLTGNPETYANLIKAGKKAKLEPSVFNKDLTHDKILDKFLSTTKDEDILRNFSNYYLKNPGADGSYRAGKGKDWAGMEVPWNEINQRGHNLDLLSDLQYLDNVPLKFHENNIFSLSGKRLGTDYSRITKELTPKSSIRRLNEYGYDGSAYNQWVTLPKKVRQSELNKLNDFYNNFVLKGDVIRKGAWKNMSLEKYQEAYKNVIDRLTMLHKNAGKGLKYKKGGSIEVELTKDEALAYAQNGYIVEEMHKGGTPHKHPHDNLTYAQRKQAYDDSLTLYDYSKDLLKYRDEVETFPEVPPEMVNKPWLYDKLLYDRQPDLLKKFTTKTFPTIQEALAIDRLTELNQENPGYPGNWVNIPGGADTYAAQSFTTYDKPKSPPRLPTMKEAYENVDKDKYPTFEDFEFAAEYYKEYGENPDPSDLPSNRLPAPPEPEYEVKDIEPEIEIDKLPIVKPELTVDASLPEELQGVDYVLDKKGNISGSIKADPGKTGNRKRNYRKLKRGKKERPLDDLNEGLQYNKAGGYVVEELPSYEPGGANDLVNPLTEWASQQESLWQGLDESNPRGRDLATGYFQNIGDNYNLSLIQKGQMPHWSAATVSNAVMANIGAADKQTAQQLGFNPTASHSGYVRDAFKAASNPDYKYNRYVAQKPDGNYSIGDILVKGRRDGKNVGTSKWSYKNFANTDKPYVSHGDIIVDKGVDDKGEYVILAGGNLGDTYKNKKVYTKNLANKYKVKLKDNKPNEVIDVSSIPNFTDENPQEVNAITGDADLNKTQPSSTIRNLDYYPESNQQVENNQQVNNNSFVTENTFADYATSMQMNQQSPFMENTLGIGYIPYQYQFPQYFDEPEQEQVFDDSYTYFSESMSDNNNSNLDDPDNTDPDSTDEDDINNNVKEDLNNITEKELEQLNDEDLEKHAYNKLTFKPKPVKFDKFEKKALSEEAKTEIQRLEDEINNLKRSPIERANEISKKIKSLEEFGDETLNERKALAKERVRLLLAIQEGAVTKGTDIDDQIKELRQQIESIKLGESAYAVESGKITEKQYYDNHHPGFIKAMETINKKMEDGFVWVSWNRNISLDELYKRGYPEIMLESLDNYQENDWRDKVDGRSNQKSNIYNSSLTDNEDVRFIEDYYGDGSGKYGQWVKAEDIGEAGGFTHRTLYPEQYGEDGERLLESIEPYNPLPQSGRVAMFYPEWNALYGKLFGTLGLVDDLTTNERITPYAYEPSAMDETGENIGDLIWSLKPKSMMGNNEKKRYDNMLEKRKKEDSDAGDKMMKIIQGSSNNLPIAGGRSLKEGGYILDLNEEEALAYAKKGYIVEEVK